MKTIVEILMLSAMAVGAMVHAQNEIKVNFTGENWNIEAKKHGFEEYKGKNALYLENGKAWLRDATFKNGIIEYDIAFEQKRNFAGVHFRIKDAQNYEEYYLRPHQSGNPDAMQYTPVINGNAGWQLYHGAGYWSPFEYKFDEWMHVKLIVNGKRMQVFIDDMKKPILNVNDLKLSENMGRLGFGTFLGAAYYANLTYENSEEANFVTYDKREEEKANSKGTVTSYQVSDAFHSKSLEGITKLKDHGMIIHKSMETEKNGLLNLSRVSPIGEDSNTVLAKFTISSKKGNKIKRLQFGYSDKIKVYVNDRLVYEGDNGYRTRDYRYLGSIGFFDTIYLNLQKGRNEIVFAVTERMGGWGIMAKHAD